MEDSSAIKPTQALIGKTANGAYRTACAKEYPAGLCEAFAASFWASIQRRALLDTTDIVPDVATEFAALSAYVDHGQMMQPDFQPAQMLG